MLQAFAFVARSGVNAGVMSMIFSSCIIFTPLIFYFKYGEKLSCSDIIGGLLIIACVIIIAMSRLDGEPTQDIANQTEEET